MRIHNLVNFLKFFTYFDKRNRVSILVHQKGHGTFLLTQAGAR